MISALTSSLLGTISPPNDGVSSGARDSNSFDSERFGAAALFSNLGASLASAAYDSSGLPTGSAVLRERTSLLTEARQQLRLGHSDAARKAAQKLLDRDARDATASYIMGQSFLAENDYEQAERHFERAAGLSPDSDSIAAGLRTVRLLKRDDAEAVDALRRLLAQRDTAREGVQLATYLVERSPGNVEARIALSDYYERSGKLNLAGAELTDALDHLDENGRRALIAHVESLVARRANDAGAHDLLAQAYAKAGRFDDAMREFLQVGQLSGGDINVDGDLAEVYSQSGRAQEAAGSLEGARRDYQKALEFSRDDVRRGDLAALELKVAERARIAGNARSALAALDRARLSLPLNDADRLGEKLIRSYELLAGHFESTGDLARTVSARRGAYLIDTENDLRRRRLADSHDVYGQSLLGSGELSGAIRNFQAALGYYPEDTNYLAHLTAAQSGA